MTQIIQPVGHSACPPVCDVLFAVFSHRMLDDFSHEMDNTQSRLDNVMKKLAKVSHMTNGNLTSNQHLFLLQYK